MTWIAGHSLELAGVSFLTVLALDHSPWWWLAVAAMSGLWMAQEWRIHQTRHRVLEQTPARELPAQRWAR